MAAAGSGCIIVDMTVGEQLQDKSFAYCDELPPDVAEGLPLTAALESRRRREAPLRRALANCKRAISRKR
jgi:hypothetical protein